MAVTERHATRRWTRDEYHRAAEFGVFRPDERLELLEGELIYKTSPQSNPHAAGVSISADTLRDAFGTGYSVREEKPIVLSDQSEPEPDLVVVAGSARQNQHHPTPLTALLVMEVSDTTLNFDRTQKAAAYALAGVKEYCVLNLRQRCLEVRRDPVQDAQNGPSYRTLTTFTADQSVAPLAAPHIQIRVVDLLPSLVTRDGVE